MDVVTYALAKKMASSVASGITEVQTDGTNIRFKTANGDWFSVRLNSVDGATVSSNGHLIIELTDGTTLDAGALPVGTMDSSLSATSENGVQNKVITTALNGKQNILIASTGVTIDTTDPTHPQISANVDYTNLINKPTKLSDFTNDEDFINNTVNNLTNYYLKTETYTQTEVNNLISQLASLSIEIVEELPTTDISTTTIYLINVSGTNNYNQWMYINNAWANLGSTSVDLTNYYTKSQTDMLLDSKVDKVIGKGLSTNDFTNAYKSVLDNYTVDSTLNSTSTNPIQNGTVTDALNTKQPKTLSVPIVVGGVTSTTVEGTLGNLNALVDTKLPVVTSLPASPSNQETVLYVGASSDGLKSGGIYQYQVSEWVLISYSNIVDTAIKSDSTWSSKKISDSLADKQDFRIFNSLEEFNEKKGTSLTVVSGIDNMADIANAMSEGDMLIIKVSYITGSEIYFGLDKSTGWTKLFTFIKSNGICDVECRTSKPTTFKRLLNSEGLIGDWQELTTTDSTLKTIQLSGTVDCNTLTEPGLYTASAGAVSSLANAPVNAQVHLDGGFSILVTNTNADNIYYGMQMFIPYGSDLPFMRKAYYLNGQYWTSWSQLVTSDNVANLKLTDFTPDDYSTEEEFYKALVSRAFTIGGYQIVEGVILWNSHWYGVVRVFSTSATSGTIEVIDHTHQREAIVKVKEDNTVTVETVVDNTSLNSALANCTISTNGNKLIIENSSYTWELTGILK